MLELISVSHRTGGQTVLTAASLRIGAGQPSVILAPAGPARSSLLRLISGQERPDRGVIRVGGQDPARARKRDVLVVRRFAAEATGQTVQVMIHRAARRGGLARGLAEVEVIRAASATGLLGYLDCKLGELDLEARIRLQLAMAAAQRPGLVLLDEPLAGLEGEARARLLADLAGMLDMGEHVVMVYATASPHEAQAIGGELVVIDGGRILQAGPAEQVLEQPIDLATARVTMSPALNVIFVARRHSVWRLGDGSSFAPPPGLPLPAEVGFYLAFRPDDARSSRADARDVRFPARGEGGETVAGVHYVRVIFAGSDWLVASQAGADTGPGLMRNVFVDRDRVMLFDANGVSIALRPPTRAVG